MLKIHATVWIKVLGLLNGKRARGNVCVFFRTLPTNKRTIMATQTAIVTITNRATLKDNLLSFFPPRLTILNDDTTTAWQTNVTNKMAELYTGATGESATAAISMSTDVVGTVTITPQTTTAFPVDVSAVLQSQP